MRPTNEPLTTGCERILPNIAEQREFMEREEVEEEEVYTFYENKI